MAVFETYALMKFLKKEIGHEKIRNELEQGGFISEATIYELFYVITRDFIGKSHNIQDAARKAEEIIDSVLVHLKSQNLTQPIMRKAILLKIQYNKLDLSHFDCLALATADYLQQPLLSGEKGLSQVKDVKVIG
ncbi:PIN domain-containing protein [Candidatus Woesearchaeota archaeon]|nr:PIN domain-containing protein [Candidatus Woesearchaeota archaeon]